MTSQQTTLSASKRAVPVKVQVLHLSDRNNFPYTSVEPRWSFTLNLMPMTKIKELRIHAAGQARRTYNTTVDGTKMEARDRDGHVFHGMETIAEEILSGETIYLIEDALDNAVEVTGKEKERGRRLLCLRSGAEKAYRTPSASSRSSSQSRKKAMSQPKMTPSQRLLASMLAGQPPKSEPVRVRKPLSSIARPESLSSPEPTHTRIAAAPKLLSKGREDVFSANDREPTVPRPGTAVARSQLGARSPETSFRLQDSQKVVPDSQVSPSRSPLQSPSASRAKSASAVGSKPDASELSPARTRSAPRLDTPDPAKLHDSPPTPRAMPSRPDPYDIGTVLVEHEAHSPVRPKIIMSSTRRLGSANQRQAPASLPHPRQPQLTTNSPSRTSKSATAGVNGVLRTMEFIIPITPVKKTPTTPIKAEVSSPAAALHSSPTDNIAAAVARGRARVKRQPIPECIVIDESSDEMHENLFRNPLGLSASTLPSLEASLPWSQPPLRVTQEPSLGIRPVARRASVRSFAGAAPAMGFAEEEEDAIDSKAEVRRLIDAAKETLAAASDSGKLKAKALPSSAISPFNLNSPVKSPSKTTPASLAGKKPGGRVMAEQPIVTIIHNSSSENENDGSVDGRVSVFKEEKSGGDGRKDPAAAVHPSSLSHHDGDGKEEKAKVIELSSDSDSLIDPAWLDDCEAELPATDEPLALDPTPQNSERPTPVAPVQVSSIVRTDPIEPSVTDEAPPSAQPDKRKRSINDEPNLQDEREKKRAKRAEKKKAKKALRRARYLENMLRIEEERKRLALEQAHRRALELEIIVSSPAKAKELGADDDDSGLDLVILDEDENVEDVGVSLDGDDNNDSSSSRGTEERPSWCQLSKKKLSSSPESKQNSPRPSIEVDPLASPASRDAYTQQQQQHDSDDMKTAAKQYHRRPFDDWAALEATLGSGVFGYSPLEVHNRVHWAMVHRSLQAPEEPSAVEPEPEEYDMNEDLPFMDTSSHRASPTGHTQHVVISKQEDRNEENAITSLPGNPPNLDVGVQEFPRAIRSGAPSPKNTPPAPQTASTRGRKKGEKARGSKSESRRRHERNRRRQRKAMKADHYYTNLRESIFAKRKSRRE